MLPFRGFNSHQTVKFIKPQNRKRDTRDCEKGCQLIIVVIWVAVLGAGVLEKIANDLEEADANLSWSMYMGLLIFGCWLCWGLLQMSTLSGAFSGAS